MVFPDEDDSDPGGRGGCEHYLQQEPCALQPSCRCPESTGPLTATGLHCALPVAVPHDVHGAPSAPEPVEPGGRPVQSTETRLRHPSPASTRERCTYSTLRAYVLFFLGYFLFPAGTGNLPIKRSILTRTQTKFHVRWLFSFYDMHIYVVEHMVFISPWYFWPSGHGRA